MGGDDDDWTLYVIGIPLIILLIAPTVVLSIIFSVPCFIFGVFACLIGLVLQAVDDKDHSQPFMYLGGVLIILPVCAIPIGIPLAVISLPFAAIIIVILVLIAALGLTAILLGVALLVLVGVLFLATLILIGVFVIIIVVTALAVVIVAFLLIFSVPIALVAVLATLIITVVLCVVLIVGHFIYTVVSFVLVIFVSGLAVLSPFLAVILAIILVVVLLCGACIFIGVPSLCFVFLLYTIFNVFLAVLNGVVNFIVMEIVVTCLAGCVGGIYVSFILIGIPLCCGIGCLFWGTVFVFCVLALIVLGVGGSISFVVLFILFVAAACSSGCVFLSMQVFFFYHTRYKLKVGGQRAVNGDKGLRLEGLEEELEELNRNRGGRREKGKLKRLKQEHTQDLREIGLLETQYVSLKREFEGYLGTLSNLMKRFEDANCQSFQELVVLIGQVQTEFEVLDEKFEEERVVLEEQSNHITNNSLYQKISGVLGNDVMEVQLRLFEIKKKLESWANQATDLCNIENSIKERMNVLQGSPENPRKTPTFDTFQFLQNKEKKRSIVDPKELETKYDEVVSRVRTSKGTISDLFDLLNSLTIKTQTPFAPHRNLLAKLCRKMVTNCEKVAIPSSKSVDRSIIFLDLTLRIMNDLISLFRRYESNQRTRGEVRAQFGGSFLKIFSDHTKPENVNSLGEFNKSELEDHFEDTHREFLRVFEVNERIQDANKNVVDQIHEKLKQIVKGKRKKKEEEEVEFEVEVRSMIRFFDSQRSRVRTIRKKNGELCDEEDQTIIFFSQVLKMGKLFVGDCKCSKKTGIKKHGLGVEARSEHPKNLSFMKYRNNKLLDRKTFPESTDSEEEEEEEEVKKEVLFVKDEEVEIVEDVVPKIFENNFPEIRGPGSNVLDDVSEISKDFGVGRYEGKKVFVFPLLRPEKLRYFEFKCIEIVGILKDENRMIFRVVDDYFMESYKVFRSNLGQIGLENMDGMMQFVWEKLELDLMVKEVDVDSPAREKWKELRSSMMVEFSTFLGEEESHEILFSKMDDLFKNV